MTFYNPHFAIGLRTEAKEMDAVSTQKLQRMVSSICKIFAEENAPYLLTNSKSYCKMRVQQPDVFNLITHKPLAQILQLPPIIVKQKTTKQYLCKFTHCLSFTALQDLQGQACMQYRRLLQLSLHKSLHLKCCRYLQLEHPQMPMAKALPWHLS